MILVTGGAGFIGSNFVLDWLAAGDEPVVNLDALTYAGNLANLQGLQGDARHLFVHGDIGDRALVDGLLATHLPGRGNRAFHALVQAILRSGLRARHWHFALGGQEGNT